MGKKKRFKVCPVCNTNFPCYVPFQKYCSPECRHQNEPFYINRKSIEKVCPVCGTKFETFRKNKAYCSTKCQIANKQKTKVETN